MMRLVAGNLNYSSWSMRAWLALRRGELDFKLYDVGLKTRSDWKDRILQFSGAGKVPVLVDGSLSIHESLAICEYAHELNPAAGLWPEEVALRARGRAISCEMASSFPEIRGRMPCNIRGRSSSTPQSSALDAELVRLFDIWDASLRTSPGSFLLGKDLTIADIMFVPVVFRLRSYNVPLVGAALEYSASILKHPLVRELEELAMATEAIAEYDAFLVV